MARDSFLLRNLPVRAFDSRAQGYNTPLARRRSSFLPPSPNLVLTRPIARATTPYQAFHDSSPPCLSRATISRREPNWSSEERHLVKTILNQPNRRNVSTDRLNHEDNQLTSSLEDNFTPTPVGKTLPYSYPKATFPRERARGVDTVPAAGRQERTVASSATCQLMPDTW